MASEASSETPMTVDETEPKSNAVPPETTPRKSSRVKILPRYLGASPGSCHDYCKYGKKHATETKQWVPLRKLIEARRAEQRGVKAGAVIVKVSPEPEPGENSDAKDETKPLKEGDKNSNSNPNPNPNAKPSKPRKRVLKKEGLFSIEDRESPNPKPMQSKPRQRVSVPPKRRLGKVSENVGSENAVTNEDVPEKTLYVIESTLENIALEPAQECEAQLSQSSRSSADLSPPSSRPLKSGAKPSRSPPPPQSLGKKGLGRKKQEPNAAKRTHLPLFDGKENGVDSKVEKTKNTKKKKEANPLRLEKKTSFSRRSKTLVSESKSRPAQKLKFRRGTILDPKPETNDAPRRLTFRRVKHLGEYRNGNEEISKRAGSNSGKEFRISEPDSVGAKTKPRKKIFPRNQATGTPRRGQRKNETGTGIGEDELVSVGTPTKRGFKRREIGNRGDVGPETVVLRHQRVEGKKEVQSLFNNVIEETASKLVEARKSKVKALVGAFETVISLQDAKPSASASASAISSGA